MTRGAAPVPRDGRNADTHEGGYMQEIESLTSEIGSMFAIAKKMACRYGQIGMTEPDDIVQTVMLKLLRHGNGKRTTLCWLCRVVRSSAMDAARIASRERKVICYDHSEELADRYEEQYGYERLQGSCVLRERDLEIDPEIDLVPRIKNMLAKLSNPLKQVLLLYSEGYSYKEIAKLTNTNVGTVRSRLHYARRRARFLLGELT